MILAALPATTLFRMLAPKWAFQPLSGAGSAKQGGRFNRPGHHALYLSFSTRTAIAEYQQYLDLLPPGTLAAYRAQVSAVADFREGFSAGSWDPLWREWGCNWRDLAFRKKVDPPSWILGDQVRKAAGKGLVFPSIADPGGFNLVLYLDRLDAADGLEVHDPEGALPRNQASWS
ncbi:MAG: RES family NAD+ phosphorylase [Holophaga sp.]|nr:RES family NAD+ phosphorylase [Holophaga sp.]